MKQKRLYLIGTNHKDINGPKRLESILNKLSPNIVAVEISPERIDASKETEQSILSEGIDLIGVTREKIYEAFPFLDEEQKEKMLILSLKAMVEGYEACVSEEYAQSNPQARMVCIDIAFKMGDRQKFIEGFYEPHLTSTQNLVDKTQTDEEAQNELKKFLSQDIETLLEIASKGIDEQYSKAQEEGEEYKRLKDSQALELEIQHLSEARKEVRRKIHDKARDETMAEKITQLYSEKDCECLVAVVGLAHLYPLKEKIEELSPILMTLADYDKI
ncbi:hypothetical protein JW756_00865 [Candidatus Woesearchaeota archaeon]|nr:hypothetical protein [Candidatus Woesearchaeota archaeon]